MREKKKQRVVYDSGKTMVNRPASWKRSASEELAGLSSKRACRTPEREEYLMNTFMEQLEIHVSSVPSLTLTRSTLFALAMA
ncbi:hypothetical protein RMATCC62417_02304 [Rhizopus microsporus]|nr:hypothetical protein RMATCC62417_02304 [Rhizopus microsporus]